MVAIVPLGIKAAGSLALAESLGFEVDIGSVIRWSFRVSRVAQNLSRRAESIDRAALERMVEIAKASAPVRTGTLVNGITGTREGVEYVFQASAVNPRDQLQYVRFVEFGVRAKRRGRSVRAGQVAVFNQSQFDEAYAGTGATPGRFYRSMPMRRVYRSHGGMEAQPFFYPAARQVLAERYRHQASEMMLAAKEAANEV